MTQNIKLLFSLLLVLFLSSCMRYKKIIYLQEDVNKHNIDSIYQVKLNNYKIQPADLVYFAVKSINPDVEKMFNILPENMVGFGQSVFYVKGYSVDHDGNINVPLIGFVHIAGYTVQIAKNMMQEKIDSMFRNTMVDFKLLSYKISILGEVKNTGQFVVYNDKINIFETLALAGDITYYGNRRKVMIMRQETDTTKIFYINLTDRSIVNSPLFYVMPNDIVYVQPVKAIGYRLSIQDFSMLIATISSSLTVLLIIFRFGL
jgi:polysaccharide biosynthesis/export protein